MAWSFVRGAKLTYTPVATGLGWCAQKSSVLSQLCNDN